MSNPQTFLFNGFRRYIAYLRRRNGWVENPPSGQMKPALMIAAILVVVGFCFVELGSSEMTAPDGQKMRVFENLYWTSITDPKTGKVSFCTAFDSACPTWWRGTTTTTAGSR